jgi:hypothetical protein
MLHGMSSNTKNVTFDGVSELDQGGANAVYVDPNIDAIGEIRVLTNAYQAEYGRTAGGGVNLVTKSGTRDFHGTMTWQHRNEGLNANSFFNNREGIPLPLYRYFIGGYSVGGPVYIPKRFNADKQKLFFFWCQEFTRNAQPTTTATGAGVNYASVPGANLQKTIPLGSEKRTLQLRIEAYSVLNHTEFNGIGSALTMLYLPFNPTPMNISSNFGQYTSTRPPRVLATTVRFQF